MRVSLLATLILGSVVAASVVAADSTAGTGAHTLTGRYQSSYGEVTLEQRGSVVTGVYACCGGGTLDGHVDGPVITYRWHEPHGAGEGMGTWRIDPRTGALDGTWGHGQSDRDGGAWDLKLMSGPVEIAK